MTLSTCPFERLYFVVQMIQIVVMYPFSNRTATKTASEKNEDIFCGHLNVSVACSFVIYFYINQYKIQIASGAWVKHSSVFFDSFE
jgi:hypothetical protein